MIEHIYIDNFKAFNEADIYFSPVNIIVGNNGAGKSTLLQILSFLSSVTHEDFSSVLNRRQLKVENIRSKLSTKKKIKFVTDFSLDVDGKNKKLRWGLYLTPNSGKNILELTEEWLEDNPDVYDSGKDYLRFKFASREAYRLKKSGEKENITVFNYTSSILKLIDTDNNDFPELASVKRFLDYSYSYDLLNPDEMRKSGRGTAEMIGEKGRFLTSFIKGLSETQKADLNKRVNILTNTIKEVETKTSGQPGWTTIVTTENYGGKNIKFDSKDISDGDLRLIAFASLAEVESSQGFILLDEIENGINTQKAKLLMEWLLNYSAKYNKQMFVTTHSTVFVDYVPPESISYIYRNKDNGWVVCEKLFETDAMKNKLEDFYPGEVLLNMNESQIIDALLKKD